MAKKKPLIDENILNAVDDQELDPFLRTAFGELAKVADKCDAGCISRTIRFGDGTAGEGKYIPEMMIRVRRPTPAQ